MRIKKKSAVISDSITTKKKQRVLLSNTANLDEIIKSSRTFEKGGMIHLDYIPLLKEVTDNNGQSISLDLTSSPH